MLALLIEYVLSVLLNVNENVPYFDLFKLSFILSGIPENIHSEILLDISKKHFLPLVSALLSLIFFLI